MAAETRFFTGMESRSAQTQEQGRQKPTIERVEFGDS